MKFIQLDTTNNYSKVKTHIKMRYHMQMPYKCSVNNLYINQNKKSGAPIFITKVYISIATYD